MFIRGLGLYTHAVTHYERVLELAEKASPDVSLMCLFQYIAECDVSAGESFCQRSSLQFVAYLCFDWCSSPRGGFVQTLVDYLSYG